MLLLLGKAWIPFFLLIQFLVQLLEQCGADTNGLALVFVHLPHFLYRMWHSRPRCRSPVSGDGPFCNLGNLVRDRWHFCWLECSHSVRECGLRRRLNVRATVRKVPLVLLPVPNTSITCTTVGGQYVNILEVDTRNSIYYRYSLQQLRNARLSTINPVISLLK